MSAFVLMKPWRIVLFLWLIPVLLLTACAQADRETLTFENLAGKRVGVMCGYSSDYILSRDEYALEIYRYDQYADMQLALKFNRLDAAAMEMDEAYVFCRIEPRFEIGLVAASQFEFAYHFSLRNQELLAQFNSFIKEFRKTEEYADIIHRVEASAVAPFVPKKVPNTVTTDRVFKVAAFDGWEPVSYINTATNEWEGGDVELVTHFANSLGAGMEMVVLSYQQMLIELNRGLVDIMLCPDSVLFKKDLEMGSNTTMSDCVFLKDIVLIVNKEEP